MKMWLTKPTLLLVFVSFLIDRSVTAPSDSTNSLVVSSTRPSGDVSEKEDHSTDFNLNVPQIYQMQVKSNISNRFAHTTVTSKVKNLAKKAQEATFSVILPESAFISGFIMEIEGNNYTAYVKEKEEAKKTYDNAVASGLGAAHVAVSARDSSRFTVSVNVEPESKASFYLIYEELLKRQDGHYELVVNLHPGQPVKDLSVEVVIAESRKITSLKAPPLRSGNEIGNEKADLDPRAEIEHINDTAAIVKFSPNLERQKEFAQYLGTKEDEGLSGQFIVQYDVEREPTGGEVFIQDGYFVHFFAPSELTALPKYVVFILDTSSSMYNQKIQQLKEAMHKILEQLNENDLFHLVEFNSYSKVWNLDNPSASISVPDRIDINEAFEHSLPKAYPANADNIKKSKNTISNFRAIAATDIHTALMTGLRLVRVTSAENSNHQPMIIFLTDGEPTNGITSTEQIIHDATKFNTQRTPIYALSFGDGADKNFLQKLALRNSGFSKHIYEAADASLQLEGFYRQISSPLLANVTFKYQPSVTSLTKTDFPIHFGGSELIVAGRSETADVIPPDVNAWNGRRHISFRPTVERSVSNVERLWAYLTVKQLLEKKEISDEGVQELKKKALDLALKYSFVTSVSSLVVVKPNATKSVDTEAADKKQPLDRPAGFISHNVLRSSIQPASRPYPSHRQYGGAGSPYRSSSGFSSNNFGDEGIMLHSRISGGASSRSRSRPSFDSYESGHQSRSSDMSRSSSDTTFRFGGSGYRAQSFSLDSDADQMTTERHQPDIFVKLPWLRGIFNQNGTISLSTGVYNLGLGEIISGTENCPKTPNNTPGYCTLLSDCEEVHSALTSISIYENHFCVFRNEYAGVCCPNMIIHRIPFQ